MATPQRDTKVRLLDLVVAELPVTDEENFARLLVSLKQAETLDEAAERLRSLPYTLFRNLTRQEAAKLQEQLLQVGVPTVAQYSLIVCPHCRLSAELEGKPWSEPQGAQFVCYACNQKFVIGVDDHLARILLECSACGKFTRLPANASSGQYACTCGAQLVYKERERTSSRAAVADEARPQAPVTVIRLQGPPPISTPRRRERSRLEAVNPMLLAFIMLGSALTAAVLIAYLTWPAAPSPRQQGQVVVDTIFKRFTTKTTYGEVIQSLGKPQVELEGKSPGERNLIYNNLDLSVTVREQDGRFYYVAAHWISDKNAAHLAVPAP